MQKNSILVKASLLLAPALALLALQSCSYAISGDLVKKADRTVTFEMLETNPDQYRGHLVIVGGRIAHITVLAQGTLVDVFQMPLDYWGKPIRTSGRQERFLLYSPQFLDPDVYSPGREITAAGEVSGTTVSVPAGAAPVTCDCPVLVSKEIRLWPRKQNAEEPDWWDPLWSPSSLMSYP